MNVFVFILEIHHSYIPIIWLTQIGYVLCATLVNGLVGVAYNKGRGLGVYPYCSPAGVCFDPHHRLGQKLWNFKEATSLRFILMEWTECSVGSPALGFTENKSITIWRYRSLLLFRGRGRTLIICDAEIWERNRGRWISNEWSTVCWVKLGSKRKKKSSCTQRDFSKWDKMWSLCTESRQKRGAFCLARFNGFFWLRSAKSNLRNIWTEKLWTLK